MIEDDINIIFSCQEKFEALCLNELRNSGVNFKFVRWLDHGAGGISSSEPFETFSSQARAKGLIFLRHIFPVAYTVNYLINNESMQDSYESIINQLSKSIAGQTFSVQMRRKDIGNQAGAFVRTAISHFERTGYAYDAKNPDFIVSGYEDEHCLYCGISAPQTNLSPWPGGMCRYAFQPDTISRAEFKLLEALEYFPLDLSDCQSGVDLGAAPGGWTKILAERGVHVTAVDPAELAPQLTRHPKVTHCRRTAEDFLRDNKRQFDILLNDMKMDVPKSVKIMNEMSVFLKHGGYAIMTFKLTDKKITKTINNGLDLLKTAYNILYCKQLFHNRMEITVICRRK